jgi:CRP/FNR family transcriptional regulator
MAVQVELLQSIPHFSGLSPAEFDSIKEFIFEKTLQREELVLIEEEPTEVLYFVASGAVKVFKTSAEGKEQILNIVRPGESINDVSIFDGGPNLTSAEAMGPVVLYGIRRSDLEVILQDYPQVALNVNKVLAGKVRILASLVEDLSFRPVIGRVAKILLENAGDGTGPRPRLTQQDMAAMAGTVREVVGRSLKALEDEGVIRLERHRIVITDKEALKDMVAAYS